MPGDRIPVEFEFQGKTYKGFLDQPSGGGNVWHLTVHEYRKGQWGNYHWGMLVIYRNDEWRMTNNRDDLLHLSDYFRDVVLNWYQ